uniref:Uncharacterized protein n=1 Tax=Knipowitschia caucasica TaxID=637954 RepID=A0AAV2LVI8_KNICA
MYGIPPPTCGVGKCTGLISPSVLGGVVGVPGAQGGTAAVGSMVACGQTIVQVGPLWTIAGVWVACPVPPAFQSSRRRTLSRCWAGPTAEEEEGATVEEEEGPTAEEVEGPAEEEEGPTVEEEEGLAEEEEGATAEEEEGATAEEVEGPAEEVEGPAEEVEGPAEEEVEDTGVALFLQLSAMKHWRISCAFFTVLYSA